MTNAGRCTALLFHTRPLNHQHLNSVKPKAQVYNSELKGFYDFQYKIDMYTLLFTHYHYLGTLGFKEVSKMYLVNI